MNDATFTAKLASVMLDNKYDRFLKGRRTGKLDTKSIFKISISDKLFKKREARKNKHYAVTLLVDCSGSMSSYSRAGFAFKAAQSLSKHLDKIGITHNILGFNTPVKEIKAFNKPYDNQITERLYKFFNNSYSLYVAVDSKEQADKFGIKYNPKARRHYVGMADGSSERDSKLEFYRVNGLSVDSISNAGDNNDPIAIKYALKELRKQEGKKILIVLSDGSPDISYNSYQVPEFPNDVFGDYNDYTKIMKSEINKGIAEGIEVYSIGIQSDAVNRFYPAKRCCSVHELGQLYDHIIKMVSINLKRG